MKISRGISLSLTAILVALVGTLVSVRSLAHGLSELPSISALESVGAMSGYINVGA